MLFGVVGAAGGWTVLTLGGFYSWIASVYGYNRDAWMTDVQLRQQFEYQCDNMQVATHEMSRNEVRDRSQAAITKLSNYILVTTLILALAAEILVEGQIPADSADFILNAYMLCLGTSVLYLVLSVLFGIVAINQIYEDSAQLLAVKIPPAWEQIDGNMKSKIGQNLVGQFESKSWGQIFMPPLLRRFARNDIFETKEEVSDSGQLGVEHQPSMTRRMSGARSTSLEFVQKKLAEEEELKKTKINTTHADLQAIRDDYNKEFKAREKEWNPISSKSYECLALGVKNLLDVYGYLCMAMLYSEFGDDWAFWAVQIIFTTLNVLLMMFLFERINQTWTFIFVASGPFCCAIAATTPFNYLDRCCVPLCYISHFILILRFNTTVEKPSCSPAEHHAEPEIVLEDARSPRSSNGYVPLEIFKDEETASARLRRSLSRQPGEAQSVPVIDDAKVSVSCMNRTTPTNGCSMSDSTMATSPASSSMERSLTKDFESKTESNCSPRPFRLRLNSDVDQHFRKQESGDSAASETVKRERETSKHMSRLLLRMTTVVKFVLRALWLISVCWAMNKSIRGRGFRNSVAVLPLTGPPLAHIELVPATWPSVYFAPHALVCPQSENIFLADEYHVYKLRGDNVVESFNCDVNGTIADISSDCNDDSCWPLVLLTEMPPRVVDCSTGKEYPLLQTFRRVEQFAVVNAYTLLAAHDGKIVEYHWSSPKHGWAPSWVVADMGGADALQALDVTGSRMLVFRRQIPGGRGIRNDRGVVQVQNLKTGKQCGVWEMPPAILGAGCAVHAGEILKLLVRLDDKVRLMQAELYELEESAQTCDEVAEDEYSPGKEAFSATRSGLRGSHGNRDNNRWLD